jgi:hypothetical protein
VLNRTNTKGKTLPLIAQINADQERNVREGLTRLRPTRLRHFVPQASSCGSGFSQDIQTGNSTRE